MSCIHTYVDVFLGGVHICYTIPVWESFCLSVPVSSDICMCILYCTILVWESLCMSVPDEYYNICTLSSVGSSTLFVLYCVHM